MPVLGMVEAELAGVMLVCLLMFVGLLLVVAGWCENRAERRLDERIADRYRRTW